MASKKCPKCGEDNPAEAVMCWACYTPLSGAVAGAGAAAASLGAKGSMATPVGVPGSARDESQNKNLDPKVIGVVAFLLIGGVIAFLVNSGGSGGTDYTPTDPPPAAPVMVPSAGGGGGPLSSAPPIGAAGGGGGGGGAVQPPTALPFKTVTPPNPQFATGTVGILIDGNKAGQAVGFARYAKDQLSRNGKWKNMQIAVFTDPQTADGFSQYQNKRRGAPLTNADFSELATRGIWQSTPVFYEVNGKQERIYKPSGSPNGWWPRR